MESWAPKGFAYDWDRIGLRIGDGAAIVKGIVVTLTVTPGCVALAKKRKANLIVAHHAPIWNPLKTLDMTDPDTRLWVDVAASGISVYAAHTNLDVAPEGVNTVLADLLGIERQEPLFGVPQGQLVKVVTYVPESHVAAVRDAMASAGAGVIGAYTHCSFGVEGTGTFLPCAEANPYAGKRGFMNEEPERRIEMPAPCARTEAVVAALRAAHPYEEPAYDIYPLANPDPSVGIGVRGVLPKAMSLRDFAAYVRTALEIQHVRMIGDGKKKIGNVAVLGGAGGSYIARLRQDTDVFVTGDVSYHEAQTAIDRGLGVIDAGHHGTERWIAPYAAERLKAMLPKLPVHVYLEPDPFEAITE